MGNKKLTPQTRGIVIRKVASIMLDDGLDAEKSFEKYLKNDITPTMKKYDIESEKTDIIKGIEGKLNALVKKPKSKLRAKLTKVNDKADTTPKPVSTKKTGKLAKIIAVRVKGAVDVFEDEQGMKVQKIQGKTKKVSLFCEENSHGEVLDEEKGEAGCVFD